MKYFYTTKQKILIWSFYYRKKYGMSILWYNLNCCPSEKYFWNTGILLDRNCFFMLLQKVTLKRKIRAMEELQKWWWTSLDCAIHCFDSSCFGNLLPQLQPQYEWAVMRSWLNLGLAGKDLRFMAYVGYYLLETRVLKLGLCC